MEVVSEDPQENNVADGASNLPDSPKDQNQNKAHKPSKSPPPAASSGTSRGGVILDTNIKRDDPTAAKRTLSSRLPFRPDHALRFLKTKKKDDKIMEIPEGKLIPRIVFLLSVQRFVVFFWSKIKINKKEKDSGLCCALSFDKTAHQD